MKETPWKIKFKDEDWNTFTEGDLYTNRGYYEITFNGLMYGSISKEAWDRKNTGEILGVVQQMLNDAYNLAIKEKEKDHEQCNLHERMESEKDSDTERAF